MRKYDLESRIISVSSSRIFSVIYSLCTSDRLGQISCYVPLTSLGSVFLGKLVKKGPDDFDKLIVNIFFASVILPYCFVVL